MAVFFFLFFLRNIDKLSLFFPQKKALITYKLIINMINKVWLFFLNYSNFLCHPPSTLLQPVLRDEHIRDSFVSVLY